MKAKDFLVILLNMICVGAIMYFGKSVLIPFVLAILIWYVVKDIRDKISNTKLGEKAPTWLINVVTSAFVFGSMFLITQILKVNISNMMNELPGYQANFNALIPQINDYFGINIDNIVKNFKFSSIIGTVLGSLTSILSNAFMIILYVIFILLEESSVKQRLKNMYSNKKQLDSALDLIGDINKSISSYISLKTLVSILTATLSYIGLRLLHVDFPVLWAIVIFVLNYIPTIGSLVATLFPALLAWLQFNSPYQALYVLLVIGSIQIVVGNFIEPKIMGNSLNISPLVVILSLSVFGSLWGITGMILCVPFTVILIIIFSYFDSTRGVAVLLSDTGILAKKGEVKGRS